ILLTLKRIIDNKRLVREKTVTDYQTQFREILMEINSGLNHEEWPNIYKKIISWELKLGNSSSGEMADILSMQKKEANAEFSKYINRNYVDWVQDEDGPIMSHNLLRSKLFPKIDDSIPNIFLLLDCLRYDQWKSIEPVINELFVIEEEDHFYSILPTATQYSRNAIFSGMMPGDIAKHYKDKWLNDNEEGGKNMHEEFFLQQNLNRIIRRDIKMEYVKVTNNYHAKQMNDNVLNYLNNDLTVIVYNFIDMMSHARTEMEVLKELAGDENAYRSLTKSWFLHSPLWSALQKLSEKKIKLFITTDHGTIRVKSPLKVVGDRETTTNLRYKVGRNLKYNAKDVLEVGEPADAKLPRPNMSSTFIFAKEDDFFLYPKNYNYYNNFYRDTFQHGGISMEEMICPFISLRSK
ncbi:MAG: PglZ domain-containing protein, partial [Bacteroidota bacterium]